jgi:Domain of unknown function (DUF1127)
MSVYESIPNRPVPLGSVGIFSVVSGAESLARRFADWRSRRATRKQLSRLSATQLQDIGLTRTDVAGY